MKLLRTEADILQQAVDEGKPSNMAKGLREDAILRWCSLTGEESNHMSVAYAQAKWDMNRRISYAIAAGATPKEIARHLGVSAGRVHAAAQQFLRRRSISPIEIYLTEDVFRGQDTHQLLRYASDREFDHIVSRLESVVKRREAVLETMEKAVSTARNRLEHARQMLRDRAGIR